MTLPVSIGPNRCELIYNHDKQPLLELSLRVCLPVKELLSMLSQLAPPVNKQTSKPQRSVAKAPPSDDKRKDPNTPAKGSSSSDWQTFISSLGAEPTAALGALPRNGRDLARRMGIK